MFSVIAVIICVPSLFIGLFLLPLVDVSATFVPVTVRVSEVVINSVCVIKD